MENSNSVSANSGPSKSARITGWVISILCILFLLFDSIMKVIREHHSIEGTEKLGWPVSMVQPLGIILLCSTILYIIPRTAVLGAILITAYLGGATATMVRVELPWYFSVTIGVLVWAGIYLRDMRIRKLIPFRD